LLIYKKCNNRILILLQRRKGLQHKGRPQLKRSVEQLPSADAREATPQQTPTQRTGKTSYSEESVRRLNRYTCSAGRWLAGGSGEAWQSQTDGRGSGGGAASGKPERGRGRRSGRCRRARRRRPAPFPRAGATPSGRFAAGVVAASLLARWLGFGSLSFPCPLDEVRFAPRVGREALPGFNGTTEANT
jgi:hypothetical protein